jgi:CheY-like chemotaxis protein
MILGARTIQVLLVESNPADNLIVRDKLAATAGKRSSAVHVDSLKEALGRLKRERFDGILPDLSLPDSQGFETWLAELRRQARVT